MNRFIELSLDTAVDTRWLWPMMGLDKNFFYLDKYVNNTTTIYLAKHKI